MSKSKLGFLVAAIATSSVLGVSAVSANPQSGTQLVQNMNRDALIANPTTLQNTNAQVTSVSQFSDVQPTDWAFTALQSLVERYGCIAGYPNGTFRGNRATSRYEFAAGLNACLDKINELISSGLADKVGKEDLATLQKLQEEFAAELAALKGRVTALEAKTATLEAQQFSTTTKLTASVVAALANASGDSTINASGKTNITLGARVRMNFNTSFSGKDLLLIRLQAGNITNPGAGNLTRLAFDENTGLAGAVSQSTFTLDRLYYRFPVTNQVNIVAGTRLQLDDILDMVNPDLESSEKGSISRFGLRDPLVFRGQQGTGAGVKIKFNDQFAFNLAYLANDNNGAAANPANQPLTGTADAGGLFGGGYSAAAQLVFSPIKPLVLSFVYQRGYDPANSSLTSGTGTSLASAPFGVPTGIAATSFTGVNSDRFGFQTNFDINPKISLNGRVSYLVANAAVGGGNANIISWLTSVTFKDLFVQGNQASIAFGQPPYVTSSSIASPAGSQNPYHIEAFYRFQLNKNISVTPGLITILNPGTTDALNNVNNSPIFVGVLRTSFSF